MNGSRGESSPPIGQTLADDAGVVRVVGIRYIYIGTKLIFIANFDESTGINHDIPVEIIVGPEFVTGSTRMKAGTAQKLVLNMISTSLMIKLGRIKGNKMVDMQLTNNKLIERGARMIMEELHVSMQEAEKLLKEFGSVRKAIASKK